MMSSQPLDPDTKACPFCAETIKAAAIVCRYCGRPLPGHESQVPPTAGADTLSSSQAFVATFPTGIEQVRFEPLGPVEIRKKGLLRETYCGRGFSFSFAVVDNVGAWVPADGELAIALVSDRSGFTRAFRPTFAASERGIAAAEREAIFFKKVIVAQADAAWIPVTGDDGQPQAGVRYSFTHPAPPLFSHESYEVTLNLWFWSINGRIFTNSASTWWHQ